MQIHEFERGLQGRVAIITGAAVGNGRAFCERLAEEGAIIVIADIADASETAKAVEATGATHFVDDLPEILLAEAFPSGVERILFDPDHHHEALGTTVTTVHAWVELRQQLLP